MSDVLDSLRGRRVPGVAATVVRRGSPSIELVSGLAERDDEREVMPSTIFAWYSLTKIVTASLALRLADEGRLDLDAPAREHVPELHLVCAASRSLREPTPRDLLCHGAGFVDRQRDVARWFREPGASFPEPRAFLSEQLRRHGPLPGAPGERLHYSNLGYAVLGEVLASAGGIDYRALVRERILEPLGMSRTGFEGRPAARTASTAHDDDGSRARGYVRRFGSIGLAVRLLGRDVFTDGRSGAFRRLRWRDLVFSPHGGLLGPIDDLARLLRVFVDDGASEGAQLITRASLDAMSTLALRDGRRRDASHGTGLGWFVDERPRVPGAHGVLLRHGGRGPGFTTEMAVLPAHGLAVGVLGNTEYDARTLARELLARAVADAL